MLKAPRQAPALIDADAWWIERRILSRELLDLGKPQLAYKLVAAHAAESPAWPQRLNSTQDGTRCGP